MAKITKGKVIEDGEKKKKKLRKRKRKKKALLLRWQELQGEIKVTEDGEEEKNVATQLHLQELQGKCDGEGEKLSLLLCVLCV